MAKFEVVFEAMVYYSVTVDADDHAEADAKALENHYPPMFALPNGFEGPGENDWEIGGTMRVRDDD